MKPNIRRSAFGALLGCLALSLIASSAFAADSIRIGSVLSTTGPASVGGEPQFKTLELYVKRINARHHQDGVGLR